jgi:hypothetical protein
MARHCCNLNIIGVVYLKVYSFIELVISHSSCLCCDDDVRGEVFLKMAKRREGPSVGTN